MKALVHSLSILLVILLGLMVYFGIQVNSPTPIQPLILLICILPVFIAGVATRIGARDNRIHPLSALLFIIITGIAVFCYIYPLQIQPLSTLMIGLTVLSIGIGLGQSLPKNRKRDRSIIIISSMLLAGVISTGYFYSWMHYSAFGLTAIITVTYIRARLSKKP